jgi:hypothetical protein
MAIYTFLYLTGVLARETPPFPTAIMAIKTPPYLTGAFAIMDIKTPP